MATKKETLKALFSNTRARIVIIFTFILMIAAIIIGVSKLYSNSSSLEGKSGVARGAGGIRSIPGSLNQTAQYAALQETQNTEQAKEAAEKGKSAIPTIIRSQAFGEGVESVGAQGGEGSVGFSTLARESLEGPQSSVWFQNLKDQHCSQESLTKALDAGAIIQDVKKACTCDQLKRKGFTLPELKRVCPCPDLRALGFSAKQFKDAGYCAAELKVCGFTACEEHSAGFNVDEMKGAGYSDGELSGSGFTPSEIAKAGGLPDGVSLADVQKAGCTKENLRRLRASGVSAAAIRRISGCSAADLKAAGYTALDLKNAGFSAAELKGAGFSAEEMRQAGYSPRDILDAGFSPAELAAAGFSPADIAAAEMVLPSSMTAEDIRKAGCSPDAIKREREAGVSAYMIKKMGGCNAAALIAGGFTPTDLARAGFKAEELTAQALAGGGQLDLSGLKDDEIKGYGCQDAQLKIMHDKGVPAKRIHDLNGCSADALKRAGFSLADLAQTGLKPQQLLAAGFNAQDLKTVGLALVPAGVIAAGRTDQCSVASLTSARALGLSAADIKRKLGCNANALKAAGFSALELKEAGFTAGELKNSGFTAADLKNAGFSAKDLRAAGVSAAELKMVGYDSAALKDAGFTAIELKGAGFTAEDLKKAGLSATELLKAGYVANDLKAAGFSASDLKVAGVSADEMKKAGFTSDELQQAGFSAHDSALAGLAEVAHKPGDLTMPSIAGAGGPLGKKAELQAANAKKLANILAQQKVQMADQKYQQKIQQRTGVMTGAANQMIQSWKAATQQAYIAGAVVSDTPAGSKGGPADGAANLASAEAAEGRVVIKVGDVMFAVMDTSVDSDEPGPILATIVSGSLKGSKLIGSFNLPSNADKMVISFNSLSMPGAPKTISISAFAIDPDTARTALASETNHHYMSRYGALFASTFLEGFGNAFQSANTTVTVGGAGDASSTTVQSGIGRSAMENAVIGLANVGKAWGQVAQQNMSRPTTVQIFSGTGIGVLFTQDIKIM